MKPLQPGEALFADTSALIAAWSRRDQNHRAAITFLKQEVPRHRLRLVITNFIFAEVHAYFSKFPPFARRVGNAIFSDPIAFIERAEKDDEDRAWKIIEAYTDKTFTFADAISFVIMERLGLRSAFAFDDHFKQYGKFRLLP